jgi:UDP-N-acetylmuramoylalanine--D-glutamate ligase
VVDGHAINWEEIGCYGQHQKFNALASLLAVRHTNAEFSFAEILSAISRYKPLPYRCEVIFSNGARKIVNDSKSTNVESTLAAMSLCSKPAILMMGGQGKGEPYGPLKEAANMIGHFITFGASGTVIAREVESFLKAENFSSMREAAMRALEISKSKNMDIVFSPGCASFDEFRNFEHRGEEFSKIVKQFNSP